MNKTLLAFGAALALSACASDRPMIPLAPGKEASFSSPQAVVEVKDKKIEFQISQASGGAAFGLLGALIDAGIDSSRQGKSEAAGAEIRDAADKSRYEEEARKQLELRLAEIPWLKPAGVSLKDVDELKKLMEEGDQAVVKLSMSPIMDPDFSVLRFKTVFELYDKSDPSMSVGQRKSREPVYRLTFNSVVDMLEAPSKRMEDNAEAWKPEGGKRVVAAIRKGMSDAFEKISAALKNPTVVEK